MGWTGRVGGTASMTIASHTVTVERRTDGTFAPIPRAGVVAPNEPIRIVAEGITNQSLHEPEFVITDRGSDRVIFRRNAGADLGGTAFLDIAAPDFFGAFDVVVNAQSFPFLPITHEASTVFQVVPKEDVPPPPPPPPERSIFPKFKLPVGPIVLGTLGIVAAAVILPKLFQGRR